MSIATQERPVKQAAPRQPQRRRGIGAFGVIKRTVLYLILCGYCAAVVLPLVWMFYSSVKSHGEIFHDPWGLPRTVHWVNFQHAWVTAGIGRYFFNSVAAVIPSLILILLISSMAAYVLGRFNFRLNRFFFYLFIAGMMIPIQLALVPVFFLLKDFRLPLIGPLPLLNTLPGLVVVYVAYSLPFTIFVLTSFFRTLPNDLRDAAAIDGCSEYAIFWRVMLPLAKPGLITVGIFNFIGLWNEYLIALVLLTDERIRTLPLGLANLLMVTQYRSDMGALLAGLTIVMLPTLIVYVLLQERLTKGIMAGALKG